MRNHALLLALAGLALSGIAKADFIVAHSSPVAGTGQLTGDDIYTIQVKNDGTNGSGTNLLAADVTMSSPFGLVIRTWDGAEYNAGDPTQNTQADFGNRGTSDENGNPRPGPSAGYVKFNPFTYVTSVPLEADPTQQYQDFGTVKQFEVVGLVNPPGGGADTTAKTIGQFVVPHNAGGVISWSFASENQTTDTGSLIIQPEPASLGLLALGVGGLMFRRHRVS